MKCPNCGGTLSLEDKYCPFCGSKNELAFQHAQDMAHYRADYEQTKREVIAGQHRLSAVMVRVIVLVALIICIGITLALLNNGVYSIQRSRRSRESEKNIAEYTQIMDQYLADQDYIRFAAFCDSHELTYLDAYDVYSPTIYAANMYCNCISDMLVIKTPGPYTDPSRYLNYLTDALADFYQDRSEYYYGDNEDEALALYDTSFAGMKRQLERCLVTYMGLTEEEARSLEGLSKAKRAVLLEEAFNRVSEQEDTEAADEAEE